MTRQTSPTYRSTAKLVVCKETFLPKCYQMRIGYITCVIYNTPDNLRIAWEDNLIENSAKNSENHKLRINTNTFIQTFVQTWGERGSCCQWSLRHDFTSEISCIFHHPRNGSFRSHQILKVNCQRIKHVGCCIKRGTILRVKYLAYFTTHKTAPLGATKSWKSIVNILNMLDVVFMRKPRENIKVCVNVSWTSYRQATDRLPTHYQQSADSRPTGSLYFRQRLSADRFFGELFFTITKYCNFWFYCFSLISIEWYLHI